MEQPVCFGGSLDAINTTARAVLIIYFVLFPIVYVRVRMWPAMLEVLYLNI